MSNIHVRMESVDKPISHFSLGISLEKINIYTFDKIETGKSIKQEEGKLVKNMELTNLFLYCNPNEDYFVSQEAKGDE